MRTLFFKSLVILPLLLGSGNAFAQEQTLPTFPPAMETPPLPTGEAIPTQPLPAAPPAAAPDATIAPAEQSSPETPAAAAPAATPADSPGIKIPSPVEAIEGLLKDTSQQEELQESHFNASYGNWKNSLFFTKADTESIRRILMLFESGALEKEAAEPTDPGISDIIRDLQIQGGVKEAQREPVYPRFKLRSVIYRSPAEWVVLLNDIRISSYNNSNDKEITVIDANKSGASFKWKPADEVLRAALAKDAASRSSSPADSALKNRAAVGARTSYDAKAHTVFFTLSVNQDFDSKTFDVQEGSTAQKAAPVAGAPTPTAPVDPAGAAALPAVIPKVNPFPSMQPITNPMQPSGDIPATAPPIPIPTPEESATQPGTAAPAAATALQPQIQAPAQSVPVAPTE